MVRNYTYEELLDAGIDPINETDIRTVRYMIDLLPEGLNTINIINPNHDFKKMFMDAIKSFSSYEDEELIKRVMKIQTGGMFLQTNSRYPFVFATQFLVDKDEIIPKIAIPAVTDYLSYLYLGHEYHHILKDLNPEEHRLKNRFSEVIPIFYELMRSCEEENDILKSEIFNRRIALLQLDLRSYKERDTYYNNKPDACMKYFNSFYYALCLYRLYREDKKKVLNIVKKVLNHEMTTLDMLFVLDIYDNGMDNVVSEEMNGIKNIIKNS